MDFNRGYSRFRGRGQGRGRGQNRGRGFGMRGDDRRTSKAPRYFEHDVEYQQEEIIEAVSLGCESFRIDNETSTFLRKITTRLQQPFDDDEEKQILLKNVFQETVGQEIKIASSFVGVSALTIMLQETQRSNDLARFFKGLEGEFPRACSNNSISFVMESLLVNSFRLIQNENNHCGLLEILEKFIDFSINYFETLENDVYGYKILLILMQILSGRNARNINPVLDNKFPEFEYKFIPKTFKSSLRLLVKKISSKNYLSDIFEQKIASKYLQGVLYIFSQNDPDICEKLSNLFTEELIASEVEEGFIPSILLDLNGTYFMQSMLEVANIENSQKIHQYIMPHVPKLCVNEIGNYVMKTMIRFSKTKEQFETLFDLLVPLFPKILSQKYSVLLVEVAIACVSLNVCQAKFFQELIKLFEIPAKDVRTEVFVVLLLNLQTYSSENKGGNGEVNYQIKVSAYGSQIIQNLLKFHKTDKIIAGILDLRSENLFKIACDDSGSYIFNAFMTSSFISEKRKLKLVEKFKNHLLELSKIKSGANMLVSFYKTGSINIRTMLAEDLSKLNLKNSEFGAMLNKACRLQDFIKSKERWIASQNQNEQKRKILDDIVKDMNAPDKKSKNN